MSKDTINREASDKSKGFRLQKIRAIELMLDCLKENENAFFFTAIENVEDVSHQTIEAGDSVCYYEEDKNYATSANFTLFSAPVLNTLVSFFDIFIRFKMSNTVYLGFYSTRNIGKEKNKKKTDESGNEEVIEMPETPILKSLGNIDECDDKLIELVKSVLVEEYARQYEGAEKGYLSTLKESSISLMRSFLKQIRWKFGQENDEELKKTVLEKIKNIYLHNVHHRNKEEVIFSILMEELDESQNKKNLNEKMLTAANVRLAFKTAESSPQDKLFDPAWQMYEELVETVNDKRNVAEKYTSVVSDYPEKKLINLARKACLSKMEESNADKSFFSLKYRVWDICHDEFCSDSYSLPQNEEELNEFVNKITSLAYEQVSELKKDFAYKLSNKKAVENIVINLFDSCFLAFDGGEYE